MITSSRGMVQALGQTYRIVERGSVHEVIRLLDDRVIGAFRHAPTLEIVSCHVADEDIIAIAREARLTGRLLWRPLRQEPQAWLAPLVKSLLRLATSQFRSARAAGSPFGP